MIRGEPAWGAQTHLTPQSVGRPFVLYLKYMSE
jgi:hypothetical protein